MINSNILKPYDTIDSDPIEYTYCRNFNHISRYKGLRQVVHERSKASRYIALESPNAFESHSELIYYTVPLKYENRMDLIAQELLGSPSYAWVIAYFNKINDGFTVLEGQRLAVPASISTLFNSGEVLQSVTASSLNLGSE